MEALRSSFHIDGPLQSHLGGAWAAWHGHGGAAVQALRSQLPWAARTHAAAAALAVASLHLLLCRRLAPGGRRLAAALPLIPLHAALPLLFDPHTELLSRAVATACFPWLASCKVRGPGLACSRARPYTLPRVAECTPEAEAVSYHRRICVPSKSLNLNEDLLEGKCGELRGREMLPTPGIVGQATIAHACGGHPLPPRSSPCA